MSNTTNFHIETLAVHAGVEPDPMTGAVMTPIYQTSTYAQDDVAVHKGYEYSRTDNPTRTALQTSLAALENGRFALCFSSGMAAIDTLLRLVKPNEHVVCGNDVYGGTYRLFDKILSQYGITFSFAETTDLDAVAAAIQPNTRFVWVETPTNPMLKLTDIAALAQVAHDNGAQLAVDNTFASPVLQRPLTLGADFVIHSTTKYIGGHSDVVGGAVITNDEAAYKQLKFLQNAIGAVPGPMDCFLTLRGIKTLALRMGAHCRNATMVAQFLADHPAVAQVIYPGLESHPQYELAQRQMAGPGGMVSFVLHGGEPAARLVAREAKLFTLAESLGGVESLIELPAPMTHASVADSPLAVDPGLVRVSVGIENADDLIMDLGAVLKKV
ncbi:MAG: cystathionine gamma-synthase [Ardenticatenaceae bacterium]|nr:cystathionine gamma-synthase [Ardenticatenaceae bacterium]